MKKILFVAAEALPFAATGGLGDVMGSLPEALAKADKSADVRAVMPLHAQIADTWREEMTQAATFTVKLSWRNLYCGVKTLKKNGVTWYFIDNEYYFNRPRLYGEYDDAERYAFFCKAVLDMLPEVDFIPDILHANDWQAAMAVVYLRLCYHYPQIRTVYTIHNIEYQGIYSHFIAGDVLGLADENRDIMDYNGDLNLTKAAIVLCDRLTTVSKTYAEEIGTPEFSHGLYHIIKASSEKVRGIVNGIDTRYYDPLHDTVLAANFSAARPKNKALCKEALQQKLGLTVSDRAPLFAMITRLAAHKGVDLVTAAIDRLLSASDMQFVILGTGEPTFEDFFRRLEARFPGRVRTLIEFNKDLSKAIYAAADFFLMPSKSEPCGLSQMIACRYGVIPLVRRTGGLADTIAPFDPETCAGNGFVFEDYTPEAFSDAVRDALALYEKPDLIKALRKNAMTADFSWGASASGYLSLYKELTEGA